MGTSRYVYNRTLDVLKDGETKASWKSVKTPIIEKLEAWAKETPYQIKSVAVRDACQAVQRAKKKCKETGQFNRCKYRSRKDIRQSIYVPKAAVTDKGVYYTLLGILRLSEALPEIQHDCRVVYENGRWFLCVPVDVAITQSENQARGVAIDPGVRTFATFFSPDCCGKIGNRDFSRIHRLCQHLDNLLSKIAVYKVHHKRWSLKRAANCLRWKIKNLVTELHNKTAIWLVKNFDVIFIPKFETSQMASKKNKAVRKLTRKTTRNMLTFAHYRFQQHLKHKAEMYGKYVVFVSEAYTSKTRSWDGVQVNIGSKEWISDGSVSVDRDINGARGIFLRALGDTPFQLRLDAKPS